MARQPRGGTYVMNNVSFGLMMLHQTKLKIALRLVGEQIAQRAAINTRTSATDANPDEFTDDDGQHLADHYRVVNGPTVVITGQGGIPGPRMSVRVINPLRHAAAREFGAGGHERGRGTRDLRRAGGVFGDIAGEAG